MRVIWQRRWRIILFSLACVIGVSCLIQNVIYKSAKESGNIRYNLCELQYEILDDSKIIECNNARRDAEKNTLNEYSYQSIAFGALSLIPIIFTIYLAKHLFLLIFFLFREKFKWNEFSKREKIRFSVLAVWGLFLGFLAVGTYQLASDGGFTNAEKMVVLPSKTFYVTGEDDFLGRTLHIQGSWRIDNEKTGFSKHVDLYECSQRENLCRVSEATVYGNTLSLKTNQLDIVKWDNEQVILKDWHGTDACRENTIMVNLVTEEVTAVVKDIPSRPHNCDKTIPILAKPRVSHLIDGFKESFPDIPKEK